MPPKPTPTLDVNEGMRSPLEEHIDSNEDVQTHDLLGHEIELLSFTMPIVEP